MCSSAPEVVDVLSADHVVPPGPDRDQIRLDLALEQSIKPPIELLGIAPGIASSVGNTSSMRFSSSSAITYT